MPREWRVKIGDKFGHLFVREEQPKTLHSGKIRRAFLCECDCGKNIQVLEYSLYTGNTKSCGCQKYVRPARKHGYSRQGKRPSEYNTWKQIKQRCYNPKAEFYPRYGGRGIEVCERWLNSFEDFLADMGKKPTPKHSIDRIDNNKDYSPENCRWATMSEQAKNRSTSVVFEFRGKKRNLTEVAKELGVCRRSLKKRIKDGRIAG